MTWQFQATAPRLENATYRLKTEDAHVGCTLLGGEKLRRSNHSREHPHSSLIERLGKSIAEEYMNLLKTSPTAEKQSTENFILQFLRNLKTSNDVNIMGGCPDLQIYNYQVRAKT